MTATRSACKRPPRWAVGASLGLSLIAVAVSSYLTVAHYADPSALACPDTGVVNCTLVTTSPESMVFGIPVAVMGLVWSMAVVGLCLPWAWRARAEWVDRARLYATGAGALVVVYLVYTELFRIGAICLWCTAMHVTAVALFGVVMGVRAKVGTSVTARSEFVRKW